jgi:hypothetical protein
MLETLFNEIKDKRRREGKRYQIHQILLLSILAILSWAKSYRNIHSFIKVHYEPLNRMFQLNWKRLPAYTTIRNIIQNIDKDSLERVFRKHAYGLIDKRIEGTRYIAIDGKTLKWSFDNFIDQRAKQIFSGLLVSQKIILFHEVIDEKSNEIPVAQKLIAELWLCGVVYTLDAMHCQKKHCK